MTTTNPTSPREELARIIDAYGAATMDIVSLMIRGDITKDARNEANERALQEAVNAILALSRPPVKAASPEGEAVEFALELIEDAIRRCGLVADQRRKIGPIATQAQTAGSSLITARDRLRALSTPPTSERAEVDVEAIKREAYLQGWNDREGDLMAAVDRIYPAPAQQVEPVAWTGSGSMRALESGSQAYMWPQRDDAHPIALYSTPPKPPEADQFAQNAKCSEAPAVGAGPWLVRTHAGYVQEKTPDVRWDLAGALRYSDFDEAARMAEALKSTVSPTTVVPVADATSLPSDDLGAFRVIRMHICQTLFKSEDEAFKEAKALTEWIARFCPPRDLPPAVAEGWGSRGHVNAVAAFLVSRCGVAVESAGDLASEMIALAAAPNPESQGQGDAS